MFPEPPANGMERSGNVRERLARDSEQSGHVRDRLAICTEPVSHVCERPGNGSGPPGVSTGTLRDVRYSTSEKYPSAKTGFPVYKRIEKMHSNVPAGLELPRQHEINF